MNEASEQSKVRAEGERSKAGNADGAGSFLRTQPQTTRAPVKGGKSLYDVIDVKNRSGIGSIIASFLPKVLSILEGLVKSLLGCLAAGADSEEASQTLEKIARKKGSGIFLKHWGEIYDIRILLEKSLT